MARVLRLFFFSVCVWCPSRPLIGSAESIQAFLQMQVPAITYITHKHILKFYPSSLFSALSIYHLTLFWLGSKWRKAGSGLGLIINNDSQWSQRKRWLILEVLAIRWVSTPFGMIELSRNSLVYIRTFPGSQSEEPASNLLVYILYRSL